jgi:hypothetical protein
VVDGLDLGQDGYVRVTGGATASTTSTTSTRAPVMAVASFSSSEEVSKLATVAWLPGKTELRLRLWQAMAPHLWIVILLKTSSFTSLLTRLAALGGDPRSRLPYHTMVALSVLLSLEGHKFWSRCWIEEARGGAVLRL